MTLLPPDFGGMVDGGSLGNTVSGMRATTDSLLGGLLGDSSKSQTAVIRRWFADAPIRISASRYKRRSHGL